MVTGGAKLNSFGQADPATTCGLSLLAVVTQSLCLHKNGQRRVAAHEVLYATAAVRNLIRESKTAQLPNTLQTGAQFGMQTMAQSLEKLVKSGLISAEEAARHL